MKKILYITILFSSVLAHNRNASNSIAENQDPKETTDFEKIKEKLENFVRHLLDIPKYIFGKLLNREKAAEENLSTALNNEEILAISVDGDQNEEENKRKNNDKIVKKSTSSSVSNYKKGINENSVEEQSITDQKMNENNSDHNKNPNQNSDDQDSIKTSSSNKNTKETQSKNSQVSVRSISWKATEDFFKKLKENKIKRPFATLNSHPLDKYQKTINPDFNVNLEFFDARLAFPYCYEVINAIADQSACGASWASAAASVMSDRRCIASKGMLKIPVSAEDLISCCAPCGFGCVAGLVDEAFNWWATHGIVTGGPYNSNSGCKPYSLPKCSHYISAGYTNCSTINFLRTPECVKKCNNTDDLDYQSELTFGRTGVMWFNSVEDIQKEILSNGPVTANFDVYDDFLTYKTGIYRHITGQKLGVHTARIIGWGTDVQSGTPYWIMANSWNENWGEKGFFKIVRGKNECGVESEVFAALPKL